MAGVCIETDGDLRDRERWLRVNRQLVAPYLHEPRECTVFTFSPSEPVDRGTTRIGGLPYWPDSLPWPVCRGCSLVRPEPLVFVTQLDFRSSLLHPVVPGDVLTLHYCFSCQPAASTIETGSAELDSDAFRQRHGIPLPELGGRLTYVSGGSLATWHFTEPEAVLITAKDVPGADQAPSFGPYFGSPHRVLDYPPPPEAYGSSIAGEKYTSHRFTIQGTKIGGYPPPIQPIAVPIDSAGRPTRFLGTCGSVGDWMWGDSGCLYLWMAEAGARPAATWFWEGY